MSRKLFRKTTHKLFRKMSHMLFQKMPHKSFRKTTHQLLRKMSRRLLHKMFHKTLISFSGKRHFTKKRFGKMKHFKNAAFRRIAASPFSAMPFTACRCERPAPAVPQAGKQLFSKHPLPARQTGNRPSQSFRKMSRTPPEAVFAKPFSRFRVGFFANICKMGLILRIQCGKIRTK